MKCCTWNFVIVDIIFFLYKTGESMLDATTRPYLIRAVCYEMFSDEYGRNESTCINLDRFPVLENYVQTRAANYLIYYRLLLNVPAIVLALFCGSYSDRYGRKIPIMLPSLGSAFAVLMYNLSNLIPEDRIALILTGSALQGFFGKSSVITMAVNSFTFDLTEPEDRIRQLGKLLAMNFFGLFSGSLLAGLFQDLLDLNAAFVCVVVIHAATVLMTIGLMEDSIDYASKKGDESKSLWEIFEVFRPSNVIETIKVMVRPRRGKNRKIIVTLFLISVINQTCKVGEMDITLLFVTHSPLSWPKSWYGYLLSLDYAVMGMCLFILLPLFSGKFKLSDVSIMLLGICCKIIRLTWAGFCSSTWMVFLSVAVGSFAGMVTSALRSLVSKAVHDDEAGKMFSLLSCGETSSKFLGTLIFVNLYSATAAIFPGIAFLVEASVYLFLLLTILLMYKPMKELESCDLLLTLKDPALSYGSIATRSQHSKQLPEIDELEEPTTYPSIFTATTP